MLAPKNLLRSTRQRHFEKKLNDHVVAISLLFIRSHVQRRTSGTFEEKLEQRSEDSVVFGGARGKRGIGGTMR